MTGETSEIINFGELSNDESLKKSVTSFSDSVSKIGDTLKTMCDSDIYNQLDSEHKVKYDIFLSYSLNSLFWLYLRTQGHDPNDHGIKKELDRVKGQMAEAKKAEERKSMPKVDQGAAKRFVRNALWDPDDKDAKNKQQMPTGASSSKKRKRND
nr:PREDICTED: nuclear nucleic acid-binding protein C1D-like [Bemisia tabaci]